MAQTQRLESVNMDMYSIIEDHRTIESNQTKQIAELQITEQSYKKEAKRNKIKSIVLKITALFTSAVAVVESGILYLTFKN